MLSLLFSDVQFATSKIQCANFFKIVNFYLKAHSILEEKDCMLKTIKTTQLDFYRLKKL